jgi:hypothetical protein
VTDYPRRNQHGDLIPFLADYLRGQRALQGQGLAAPDDMTQVARLGKAIADQEPKRTREQAQDLDQIVAQIKERNRAERAQDQEQGLGVVLDPVRGNGQGPQPSPKARTSLTPEVRGMSELPDKNPGATPFLNGRRTRNVVGIGKIEIRDSDDERWTPA